MARRPVYNRHTGVLIPPPGPYSGPHVLYTAHGKLPGGESWSCGLRTGVISPSMQLLTQMTNNAETAWQAFWSGAAPSLRDFNPSGASFDGITGRALTAEGVTVFQYDSTPSNALPGDAGTAPGGDQLALVVSLHTALSGRHGRGRIYLPFLSGGPDPLTGKLSAATVQTIATGATTLIDMINTSPDTGVIFSAVCIQSRTSGLPPAPVTRVTVGDVLDTVRGRRRKLKEVYQSGTAVTPPVVGP